MTSSSNYLGIKETTFLLPKNPEAFSKWSVIACDQYSANPEYWARVEKFVGSQFSTLNCIVPENKLKDKDLDNIIQVAQKNMKKCIDANFLEETSKGIMLVERTFKNRIHSRQGALVLLDLENYDYKPSSLSLVRPTEGTIIDRLPVREKTRLNASLEMSHILVLYDDPDCNILEPLMKKNRSKLYDTELMNESGNVSGYLLQDPIEIDKFKGSFESLIDKNYYQKRYNLQDIKDMENPMLFAMGDGNHSLAAAKNVWEIYKKETGESYDLDHPSRYAIVELQNLHSAGIQFEPIHRFVFNTPLKDFSNLLKECYPNSEIEFFPEAFSYNDLVKLKIKSQKNNNIQGIPFRGNGKSGIIWVKDSKYSLEIASLQILLDIYASRNSNVEIEYIHGEEELERLTKENKNSIGFFLPKINKFSFFEFIIKSGTVPRKSFSIGEPDEKRFYLETRKLFT